MNSKMRFQPNPFNHCLKKEIGQAKWAAKWDENEENPFDI
jgi:hypothetical protein